MQIKKYNLIQNSATEFCMENVINIDQWPMFSPHSRLWHVITRTLHKTQLFTIQSSHRSGVCYNSFPSVTVTGTIPNCIEKNVKFKINPFSPLFTLFTVCATSFHEKNNNNKKSKWYPYRERIVCAICNRCRMASRTTVQLEIQSTTDLYKIGFRARFNPAV